ncbi:MAG: protein kinase, partial [Myxococcales bacterium]|nr:protein kinase [Myxococcales bacterium]
DAAARALSNAGALRAALASLAALALVALLARVLRRRGDLVVHLTYPAELRATFRVRIDRHRRSWKRRMPESDAEILKGGVASAREHHLVARETPFRRLPCRRYFVTVDGVLQDPHTGEVLEHPFAQTTANVLHRRTVRCDLDVTPAAAPVDVVIAWDGQAPREAIVAARGHARGPVEVESGRVRLRLPLGTHAIVVGSGDRVAERRVAVRSHLPSAVDVELGQGGAVVFKACPPAVEPYVAGRIEAAAQALARDGQSGAAHRLLARRNAELGRTAEAALHHEAAGDFLEAAELHAQLRNYAHAGELFGRADDPVSAAEMFQIAGDPVRAGRAFEQARDFDSAIACYREAGDAASWVEALERRGDVFEAARTALEHDLPTRGIRLLQRVAPDDPNYADACLLLTDTFERERHFDLAARKLSDYFAVTKPGGAPAELYARLADLHERAGDIESALDVLETLRLQDPSYPNLATRTEQLRKARSAKRHVPIALLGDDAGLAPTILLADQRYELIEEIGRGGMGVVWRARDRRLGRVVALKRLSDSLRDHPRAVELFLREARAAASLNHPNIVTVFDADQEDGTLFITMELLDGQPLHQLLRRRGRLASSEIAHIGWQVCAGLQYAHERGIVHRDVKTANLFVSPDQRVKIMDFGLAKVAEEVRRSASLIGGTPYYMAPEQTLGGEIDARADLYGLGVTLFELATGRVPFPDGDPQHHSRHTAPPDPRELAPDVDDTLAALVLELLAKDPDARPASAAEVARRLAPLDPLRPAERAAPSASN